MNPSTSKAAVLVDEWVRGGVTEAVACPGSRNAPLLLALHAADRRGALRLHVRTDERGAGFLAAGLAARSGRVVPVVVTSGTAVANLHPAVLEASHAGIPLLVVSADRPLELVPTGANQTVDQVGLFGAAVRASLMLGPDDDRPGAVDLWRSTAVRALDRAIGGTSGDPGPVQLDVPLREPLVPGRERQAGAGATMPSTHDEDGRPDGAPWTRVRTREVTLGALAPAPGLATLVVAGHGGGRYPPCARLPEGVPVLAEPSAPAWSDPGDGCVLPAGARVLGVALDGHRPDLKPEQVVVLGRPTLHRSVSRLLADPAVRVLEVPALAPDGRPRPGWADTAGVVTDLGALPADPASWAPDPAFARAWVDAATIADASEPGPVSGALPTGRALAAATVAAVPPGALLVLGSSNPVRDVALAARPRADVRVLAGRGVSGIDGTVSLAVGAALAHDGPTYALLGDLTFLHDASGLHLGADEPVPELTVVVADDVGGGIFTVLEQGAAEYEAAFERVFATPHRVDVAALCAAYRVGYRRVADLADLTSALTPTGEPGLRVVQVPIDRAGRRAASVTAEDALREALITAR